MKQTCFQTEANKAKVQQISYHQYLQLEKRFYETTAHLTKTFQCYMAEKIGIPPHLRKQYTACKNHAAVYTFIKSHLIDWSIPFPETMLHEDRIFTSQA